MTGSAVEPTPEHAAEQMRAATERLRDKAWMVSSLTSPSPSPDSSGDHAEGALSADA